MGLASKLVLRHAHQPQEQRLILVPAPCKYGKSSVVFVKAHTNTHVTVTINKEDATKVYTYSLDRALGRVLDSGDLQSKLFLCYLHALTSHCLPDPLTGRTGTESALVILQSAAVRSFEFLEPQHVELLQQISALSPGRAFYPRERMEMQRVLWDKNLPALSQHPGFRTHVQELLRQAQKMQIFYPSSTLDTSVWKASSPHLDARDAMRSSTFRTCGFGTENFTVKHDVRYDSRDIRLDSDRSQRAFVAARLIVRDQDALHTTITDLKGVLRAHFGNSAKIFGCNSTFDMTSLRYGSEWMEKTSRILEEHWCNLHSILSVSSSVCNKFDIAAWLSTMSYSTSADMNVTKLSQPSTGPETSPLYSLLRLPAST